MIAGVAAGVAHHLDLEVRAVRVAFVVAGLASGLGLVLYVWLWALAPDADAPETMPERAAAVGGPGSPGDGGPVAAAHPSSPGAGGFRQPQARELVVGALLVLGALAVLGARAGLPVSLRLVLPVLVALGGLAIVYTQLDEVQRDAWTRRAGADGKLVVTQIAVGLVLVLGGVLFVVQRNTDPAVMVQVVIVVAAMLAGLALALAPWGLRLWRDLDDERAARVRESERAAIAAHLHDSVLQTLALVQRSSTDPTQVQRLARAQERDLRDWLYGSAAGSASSAEHASVSAAVRRVVAEVEDDYGVPVDVVIVGDLPADEAVSGLVAALREALLNAVRHAGPPVSVYVEVTPGQVEAFVRDRGPGFDLAQVPADRLGVRTSVIDRMQRLHGTATVRSSAGEGTEVALVLPVAQTKDSEGQ
jgi:signal transduction histidine kinase/phage shock protein PspC (stress-responsive transcriptional regulator)